MLGLLRSVNFDYLADICTFLIPTTSGTLKEIILHHRYMVSYCRNKAVRKLVSYIERRYPKVLFTVRSRNRKMGRNSGLPDVLVFNDGYRDIGLAMWAESEISEREVRQMERFINSGHDVVASSDYGELKSILSVRLSQFRSSARGRNEKQLGKIKSLNRSYLRRYAKTYREPLTPVGYATLREIEKFVRKKYGRAAIIPSFGSLCGPDLTIISPNSLHDGLAIWLVNTQRCYRFSNLTDKQLSCLRVLAKRSYITVASDNYSIITDIVINHMEGKYEDGNYLPEFG